MISTKDEMLKKNRDIGVLLDEIFSSIRDMRIDDLSFYVSVFDETTSSLMDDLSSLPDNNNGYLEKARENLTNIRHNILGKEKSKGVPEKKLEVGTIDD